MTIISSSVGEAEAPLLNDVVPGSVDFNGRTSVRSKSGCRKSSSLIIGAGVAERITYYALTGNLISYLTEYMGQPTSTAASMVNAWFGAASLIPILGAFLADSFIGRFRMIIISCVLYVLGLGFLSLSAFIRSIEFSKCKPATACAPGHLELVFLYSSLYLVAFAQGGLTPSLQAFGADQFDELDKTELKAKASFFNWWYFFGAGGIIVPVLLLTYIQENVSWVIGLGIPTIVIFFALVLFLIGRPAYRFPVAKPSQNRRAHPADVVKSIIRLLPIWCACLGYSIIYTQPSSLFTKQLGTIDRHVTANFEIPAASLQNCFITTTVTLGLLLYERVLVPLARKITKTPSGISALQRISFGLFSSFVSIAFAAFVERKRLLIAKEHGLEDMPWAVVPMSIWWFAPQYVLSGVTDVFAMVGLQEFFYDQVPSELKSVGLAMNFSLLGIGSLLSSFLVSTIQSVTRDNGSGGWFSDNLNRAHLDYFYWLLAGISATGFVAFIFCTRSYKNRSDMCVILV